MRRESEQSAWNYLTLSLDFAHPVHKESKELDLYNEGLFAVLFLENRFDPKITDLSMWMTVMQIKFGHEDKAHMQTKKSWRK